LVGSCGPDSRIANVADDLENASDRYGNRTKTRVDRIGNDIAPVIERTIDRLDGNTSSKSRRVDDSAD